MGSNGGRGVGGGAVTEQTLYNAFLQALADSGGTGGASGQTFPDLIVSGSASYVIPTGFNAVANLFRGVQTLTYNGFPILTSSIPTPYSGGFGQFNTTRTFTLYNNPLISTILLEGSITVNNPLAGIPQPTIFRMLVDGVNVFEQTIPSLGAYASYLINLPLTEVSGNGLVQVQYISNPFFATYNSSYNIFVTESSPDESNATIKALEGDVISGGKYIIELYTI